MKKFSVIWKLALYTVITVTHVIAPFGYILDWLLFDEHGHMKWKDGLIWVVYPILYFAFTIYFAIKAGFNIYFFLDLSKGYKSLFYWLVIFVCMMIFIVFAIIGVDKLLKRKKNA